MHKQNAFKDTRHSTEAFGCLTEEWSDFLNISKLLWTIHSEHHLLSFIHDHQHWWLSLPTNTTQLWRDPEHDPRAKLKGKKQWRGRTHLWEQDLDLILSKGQPGKGRKQEGEREGPDGILSRCLHWSNHIRPEKNLLNESCKMETQLSRHWL